MDGAYEIFEKRIRPSIFCIYDDDAAYAALDRLMKKKWRPKTAGALEQMRDTLFLHSDFDEAAKMAGEILR